MSASNNMKVSTGTVISIEATTLNFQSNYPPLLHGRIVHSFSEIFWWRGFEVKHIEIQINNFNSSKPYAKKIVQVPLVLGDKNAMDVVSY